MSQSEEREELVCEAENELKTVKKEGRRMENLCETLAALYLVQCWRIKMKMKNSHRKEIFLVKFSLVARSPQRNSLLYKKKCVNEMRIKKGGKFIKEFLWKFFLPVKSSSD